MNVTPVHERWNVEDILKQLHTAPPSTQEPHGRQLHVSDQVEPSSNMSGCERAGLQRLFLVTAPKWAQQLSTLSDLAFLELVEWMGQKNPRKMASIMVDSTVPNASLFITFFNHGLDSVPRIFRFIVTAAHKLAEQACKRQRAQHGKRVKHESCSFLHRRDQAGDPPFTRYVTLLNDIVTSNVLNRAGVHKRIENRTILKMVHVLLEYAQKYNLHVSIPYVSERYLFAK